MWCREKSRGKEAEVEEKPMKHRRCASSSRLNCADTLWKDVAQVLHTVSFSFILFFLPFQQYGKILDVEIIFNERGSKV